MAYRGKTSVSGVINPVRLGFVLWKPVSVEQSKADRWFCSPIALLLLLVVRERIHY